MHLQPPRRLLRAEDPCPRLIDERFDAPPQLAAALGNPRHDPLIERFGQLATGTGTEVIRGPTEQVVGCREPTFELRALLRPVRPATSNC